MEVAVVCCEKVRVVKIAIVVKVKVVSRHLSRCRFTVEAGNRVDVHAEVVKVAKVVSLEVVVRPGRFRCRRRSSAVPCESMLVVA
eukprot:6315568-Amphidinium_carterae.1